MRKLRIPTPALNAFLAGRPVEPIGYRRDGRPILPIAGGAPDDDGDGDGSGGGDGSGDGDGDGEKFVPITSQEELDKRLGKRLAREREKFPDYDELKEKASKYDEHVEASRTEQEKAVEEARKAGETTATERYNAALIEAKAEAALATAKFRNPATAVRLLDLTGVTVSADGKADGSAIKAAIDKLAETEPYLVESADDGKTRRKPDRHQGGDDDKPTASVSAGRDLYAEEKARRAKKTS